MDMAGHPPPVRGVLRKMKTTPAEPVEYQLPLGERLLPLNRRIGKFLSLVFTGNILCVACGRKTNKSFAQGYCYPCFKNLAECDLCIMRPETCHYHRGTCRDEKWADGHCMQRHCVYIANSSGLKVGITRGDQIPTRWIDQGASQAIAVFEVKNRLHSGLIESALKNHLSDRTDWRKMLTGGAAPVDVRAEAGRIIAEAESDLAALANHHTGLEWRRLDRPPAEFTYPVLRYPEKATALSFDKTPEIRGILHGIKGQYLLLDGGVLNIRKFGGYEVVLE